MEFSRIEKVSMDSFNGVSDEDQHLFLADSLNCSIVELTETGDFVVELTLKLKNGQYLYPQKIFFYSSEILVAICWLEGWEDYITFLQRKKNLRFFLEIRKIIPKERVPYFRSISVCKYKNNILICDSRNFKIHFLTQGNFIKAIDIEERYSRP